MGDNGEADQAGKVSKKQVVVQQSDFFKANENALRRASAVMNVLMLLIFVVAMGIKSYIALQTGDFPFNVPFLANMAYREGSSSDTRLALLLALLSGLLFYALEMGISSGLDMLADRLFGEVEIVAVKEAYGEMKPKKLAI